MVQDVEPLLALAAADDLADPRRQYVHRRDRPVHGVDEHEQPVLRRQIRRGEVEKVFAKLAPTRIGLEACGASHHWARLLRGLGHEVMLIPPQCVKAYVKRGKNDAIDAEAICEAMSRPTMRFVPVKRGQAGPRRAMAFGVAGAQGEESRRAGAGQQNGPHRLGDDGERRDLSPSDSSLSPPTPRPGTPGAGEDSNSKMAIGRSEDRDNPRDPLVLRHHHDVWDPVRVPHLGQRSFRPHHTGRTYDRNRPDPSQLQRPCETGAVHIWVPAFAGKAERLRFHSGGSAAGRWGTRM